jgi:hypothetical protein
MATDKRLRFKDFLDRHNDLLISKVLATPEVNKVRAVVNVDRLNVKENNYA